MKRVLSIFLLLCCSCGFGCLLTASMVQSARWPVLAGGAATTTTTTIPSWTDPATYLRYYDFNTNDGTAFLDTSGNGNHLTNSPTWGTGLTLTMTTNLYGRIEYFVSADGSDDYGSCVRCNLTQPMTFGGWWKWNGIVNAAGNIYLICDGRSSTAEGFGLYILQNTTTLRLLRGGVVTDVGAMPSNQWLHISCVKAADVNWAMETNGVRWGLGLGTAPAGASVNYNFAVAASYSTGPTIGRYWPGLVDEVFVTTDTWTMNQQWNHYFYTPPEQNLYNCNPGGNIRVRGTP